MINSLKKILHKVNRSGQVKLPNFENDKLLKNLHNIHTGKRAFLLGNGPSLNLNDINLLKNEITFASNKIYLIYDQTDWRPTYLTVCDDLVAQNINHELKTLKGSTKIFGAGVSSRFDFGHDIIFVNWPTTSGDKEWNPIQGMRAGHSVVNLDIKLAYWMGIRELYVIGLDFSFQVPKKTTGEQVFGNDVIVSEGEVNHFHPEYRKPGEKWTVPQLDIQREEFIAARKFLESKNGKIYNASRSSKLDVWDKVCLDDII